MYLGNVARECRYSSFVLHSTAACTHRKFRPKCLCATLCYIHCGTASVQCIRDQACAAPFGGLVPASLPVCIQCHSMVLTCMWIQGGKIISKVHAQHVWTCGGLIWDWLHSTKRMMLLLLPVLITYAWTVEKRLHISAACMILFSTAFLGTLFSFSLSLSSPQEVLQMLKFFSRKPILIL